MTIDKIEVNLLVNTPLFMGGADYEHHAELREQSIKGVLRFWYRALKGRDLCYEDESKIFGSTDTGQGCFILRIKKRLVDKGIARDDRWNKTNIAYLGYGVIVRDNIIKKSITTRPYIKEKSRFKLEIIFKPLRKQTEEKVAERAEQRLWVEKSLWAFVMFGGLGARSRKGFGSIQITSQMGMSSYLPSLKFKSITELQTSIIDFLKMINNNEKKQLPNFTYFSEKSRCAVIKKVGDAMTALELLGNDIHHLRSWKGSNHLTVDNKDLIKHDHHLMRDFISTGKAPSQPPYRAAFGLPHNYFFTSLGYAKGEVNLLENNKSGRRASPIFFTCYEFPANSNQETAIIMSFLPAELVPRNVQISCDAQRPINIELDNEFKAVNELFNQLAGGEEL